MGACKSFEAIALRSALVYNEDFCSTLRRDVVKCTEDQHVALVVALVHNSLCGGESIRNRFACINRWSVRKTRCHQLGEDNTSREAVLMSVQLEIPFVFIGTQSMAHTYVFVCVV